MEQAPMRASKFLLATILTTLVWVGGPAIPSAHAVFLDTLLVPGATLTSGDLTFSNFTYTPPTGPPAPSGVTVTAFTDASGFQGIQIGGGFIQLGPGTTFVQVGYTVTDNLGRLITDVHMDGNPTITPADATGIAMITESVFAPGVVGAIASGQISSVSPPASQSTTLILPDGPYTTLNIIKGVQLAVGTNATAVTSATVSFINQTFSVATSVVPEPASFVMMGLGVGAVGLVFRRRMAVEV
jgi:hypothetical protein